MFGNDIENILNTLNEIKDSANDQIHTLMEDTEYQMYITPRHHTHIHPIVSNWETGPNTETILFKEDENGDGTYQPLNSQELAQPILDKQGDLDSHIEKLNSIASDMYVGKNEMNNQYGSPWTEMKNLKSNIEKLQAFVDANPLLKYLGQKYKMATILQTIISSSIDAKYGETIFQDWIQRGFDHKFNEKKPSITWDYFNSPNGKGITIGNKSQQFDENVFIEMMTEDPF